MSIDKKFKDFLNEKSSAEVINPEKKVPNPKGGKPPRKTQFRNGNNANPNTNGEFQQPGNGENGEEEPNGEFKPERKKPVVVATKKKRPKNDHTPTKKEVDKVIDCEPKFNALPEAASVSPAVFTFGRMNPPTIGHDKLVKKVFKEAKKNRGTPYIYLSHSEGKKTDPIPYKNKVRYAQKAWGGSVVESRARTIIQILQEIAKAGHKSVTMVVGSDRVRDFDRILKKYNGKDYTFENVNVVSAGQRDPDAEGAAGMSASKMRELASNPKAKDFKERILEFKKGLPRKLQRDFLIISRHIKEEFELAEDINLLFEEFVINDEDLLDITEEEMDLGCQEALEEEEYEEEQELDEVLSLQARRKRALMLKRMMPRIMRARKLKKNRMATPEMLRRRALRAARTIIRRKIIGAKGANYSKLSVSMKIQLDKRVAQKQKIIQRIAKRLAPKIRQAEMVRLRNAKSPKPKQSKKLTPSKIMTTNEAIIAKAQDNDVAVNELFEQYQLGRQEPHGQQTPEQGGFARMAVYIAEISVDKATGRKKAGTWGRTTGGYGAKAAKQSKKAGSKGARRVAKKDTSMATVRKDMWGDAIERDSDVKRIKARGPDGRTIWKNVRRKTEIEPQAEGIISGTGKAIGWTAKKAVAGGKYVAHKASTAGRADSAEKKLKKQTQLKKDRERLSKAKAGLHALRNEGDEEADKKNPVAKKHVGTKEWKALHDMDDSVINDYVKHKEVKEIAPDHAGIRHLDHQAKLRKKYGTHDLKKVAKLKTLDVLHTASKKAARKKVGEAIGDASLTTAGRERQENKKREAKERQAKRDHELKMVKARKKGPQGKGAKWPGDFDTGPKNKSESVIAQFEPEYSEKKREIGNKLRKKIGIKQKPKLDWKKKAGLSDAADPEMDRLKATHKDEKERVKDTHTKELERLKMRKSRRKIRDTSAAEMESIINDVDMLMEALNLDERIEKEREEEYDVSLSKKVNQLLRMGLADKGELQTYQRALRGGQDSLKNPKLRKKLHQLLAKLLSIIETNPATFIKIRAEVQKGKTKGELDPNRFVDA